MRKIPFFLAAVCSLGWGLPITTLGAETFKKTLSLKIPSASEVTTEVFELPNGLTVALTPNERAPLAAISHWVKSGSLEESPGTTGIAHLFEHMMFRPLHSDQPDFFTLLKKWGGDANANTRYAATVYTTSVPAKNLREVLRLESDRFKKLRVTDELLNIERKAVWSEYSTKFDNNPILDLWYVLYQNAFPGHPFGWTVIGRREDLEKIKAEDCNKFFNKNYRPNNVGLFISGPINVEQTLAWIQELYSDWQRGTPSDRPGPFRNKNGTLRAAGKLPAKSRNVLLAYRIPEPDGKNHHLMSFVNYLFYESHYSLAKRRLVDSLKLASQVSDFNFDYDNGMMKAFVALLPGASFDKMLEEFQRLTEEFNKLDDREFQAFVANYRLSAIESLQRNENLNDTLAFYWGKYGNLKSLEDLISPSFQISREDVKKFAKATFVPENLVIATNKDFQ